jgi:hypothetical protein
MPNYRMLYYNVCCQTFALGKNQAGIFRSLCLIHMKASLPKIGILGTRLTNPFFNVM